MYGRVGETSTPPIFLTEITVRVFPNSLRLTLVRSMRPRSKVFPKEQSVPSENFNL